MFDDLVTDAPEAMPAPETGTESAVPAEEQAPAVPASPSEETAHPEGPDVATLLSDPTTRQQVLEALAAQEEARKELYSHPAFKQDVEHRAQSEAGRRFKAWQESELARIQSEQAARTLEEQRRRELEMDEYDLGRARKEQLLSEQQMAEFEARLRPQVEARLRGEIGVQQMSTFYTGLLQGLEFTPEEMARFAPQNFVDPQTGMFRPEAQLQHIRDYVLEREVGRKAEALLKERLPKEVEAAVAERLRGNRESEPSPVGLPPGGATSDDSEFMKEYSNGRSDDHARAARILASL